MKCIGLGIKAIFYVLAYLVICQHQKTFGNVHCITQIMAVSSFNGSGLGSITMLAQVLYTGQF